MDKSVFTPEQVESLNAYQVAGIMHPYTCGNGCPEPLVATCEGWICKTCDYTQDWALDFMTNWEWKKLTTKWRN